MIGTLDTDHAATCYKEKQLEQSRESQKRKTKSENIPPDYRTLYKATIIKAGSNAPEKGIQSPVMGLGVALSFLGSCRRQDKGLLSGQVEAKVTT